MTSTLPPLDLPSRLPVWEALADFWLDTALVDFELDHIARVIATSPYSIAELRAIHDYEVAPAVSANLLAVAGAWAGFGEWLIASCLACAARCRGRRYRGRVWLQRRWFWRMTADYWAQLIPRVLALRPA